MKPVTYVEIFYRGGDGGVDMLYQRDTVDDPEITVEWRENMLIAAQQGMVSYFPIVNLQHVRVECGWAD